MSSPGINQWQCVDARLFLPLLSGPDAREANNVLREIRREIVRLSGRSNPQTWQEAWNTATGAKTRWQPGILSFYANVKCSHCRGRRFDPHTGTACLKCIGRGSKNKLIRLTARYAQTLYTN